VQAFIKQCSLNGFLRIVVGFVILLLLRWKTAWFVDDCTASNICFVKKKCYCDFCSVLSTSWWCTYNVLFCENAKVTGNGLQVFGGILYYQMWGLNLLFYKDWMMCPCTEVTEILNTVIIDTIIDASIMNIRSRFVWNGLSLWHN
jgi:hypothetical protein